MRKRTPKHHQVSASSHYYYYYLAQAVSNRLSSLCLRWFACFIKDTQWRLNALHPTWPPPPVPPTSLPMWDGQCCLGHDPGQTWHLLGLFPFSPHIASITKACLLSLQNIFRILPLPLTFTTIFWPTLIITSASKWVSCFWPCPWGQPEWHC